MDAIRGEIGNPAVLFVRFEPPEDGEEWGFVATLGSILRLPGDVVLGL